MSVTKDSSGWYTPAAPSEWTALLAGTGISNPASIWLCQEPSGNLSDVAGGVTLTALNSPNYQTSVPLWSRKAVSWVDGTTAQFTNTTTAPNPMTTSIALLVYAYVSNAPGSRRFIASVSGLVIAFSMNGTNHAEVSDSGQGASVATINDGIARPYLLVLNNAASTCKLYTTTEIVSTGFYNGPGSTIGTSLGAIAGATPTGGILYASQWAGPSAEFTDANAQKLMGLLANGPLIPNWPYSNRLPQFTTTSQRAGFVEVVLTATPATAEWTALNLEVFGRPGRAPSRNRS